MTTPVLVLTPTPAFGEFIQQVLEETGLFRVTVVEDALHLPEALAQHGPQVVIVDGDVEAIPLGDLLAGVRQHVPRARVVVLPPEGMDHAAALHLGADAVLDKPFFAPDLLALLERWEQEAEAEPAERPGWLADVQKAARYLTQLALETAALASALVTRDGRLLAYAGQLPRLAAEEMAQMVAYYWEGGGRADFARYLTLESAQGEFMLYVTPVARDVVLAVLFDAEMPFSQIRGQASQLAQALAEAPATLRASTPSAEAHAQAEEATFSAPPALTSSPDQPATASSLAPTPEEEEGKAVGGHRGLS